MAEDGVVEGKLATSNLESVRSDHTARDEADWRARDESVERATRGLIRLEGRRRRRTIARRLGQIIVVTALVGSGGYYAARYVPKATVQHYWQELKSKMPVMENQSPPRESNW